MSKKIPVISNLVLMSTENHDQCMIVPVFTTKKRYASLTMEINISIYHCRNIVYTYINTRGRKKKLQQGKKRKSNNKNYIDQLH
jgi:hypothetical protein